MEKCAAKCINVILICATTTKKTNKKTMMRHCDNHKRHPKKPAGDLHSSPSKIKKQTSYRTFVSLSNGTAVETNKQTNER